jgi:hypothetical protein
MVITKYSKRIIWLANNYKLNNTVGFILRHISWDSAHYIIYLQFYPRDRETSNVLLNIIIMIYIYYFVFRHNNVSSKMNQWPAYFKCFLALDNIILPILYLALSISEINFINVCSKRQQLKNQMISKTLETNEGRDI